MEGTAGEQTSCTCDGLGLEGFAKQDLAVRGADCLCAQSVTASSGGPGPGRMLPGMLPGPEE